MKLDLYSQGKSGGKKDILSKVQVNQGKSKKKNREHFSWSPEIFIFQNKSVNFINFLNLWNLVL